MLLKSAFAIASPKGHDARLSVMMFHRVAAAPDPMFPDEMHSERFDQVCGWLSDWLNVLPMDEAVARLRCDNLPARAACITFDDGYADNHDVALPILKRRGLSATFFIATGFLDGGRMWNDALIEAVRGCRLGELDLTGLGLGRHSLATWLARRRAAESLIEKVKYRPLAERVELGTQIAALAGVVLPSDLMMTSRQIVELRRSGMCIGAHTVSHPILAKLDEEAARSEIQGSKDRLEQLLGERVGLFAYPNGKPGDDYTPANAELVRSVGFDAAVSTAWGTTCGRDDLMQMRRFTPWDRSRLSYGLRLLNNLRRH